MASVSYETIVRETDHPTLVLAGPGAGKTHLLADRVKWLLQEGLDKTTIRVLAFNIHAVQNMYSKLLDSKGQFGLSPETLPEISTMHSLAFEIVNRKPRQFGLRKKGLSVQDNEPVKRLVYRDAALLLGQTEEESKAAKDCKERGDCDEQEDSTKCAICRKYWEIMSKCNRIDFDDQILFALRVLRKDADILAEYQARCAHLLVDEYQDINAAQFHLIELLSRRHRNGLFVVGDDAQNIYGFRGAYPGFILRFKDHFASATVHPLAHSHRCHAGILEAAVKVLKVYYTDWTGPVDLEYHRERGEAPAVWQLPSDLAEAEMVVRMVKHFINAKKSVLVLAPKKDFFRLISKELRERGVAHECTVSLLPNQVQSRLRSIRVFLQWVRKPGDNFLTRLAIEELINRGAAKVPGASKSKNLKPETCRRRVQEEAGIAGLWESVNRKTNLYQVVQNCRDDGTKSTIRDVLAALLNAYANFEGENKGDFAKHLAIGAGVWANPSKMVDDICFAMSLLEPASASSSGFARLVTMRKAKGLEAQIVIIVGLEDDILPNSSPDLAEEARLFYVSMTRAEEKLFLFHAYKRPRDISWGEEIRDKERSRFLDALGIPSEFKKPRR
jgi:DNA helicase-2/ATP-dependent DNA helicase PcrA